MINTLIIDDSSLARDMIRDFLLEDGGFRIIGEAVDGEEGIQKILSLNPDLVTLDIEMPKKNGLEVIEAVIKDNFVPIVVITNHDTAKIALEATIKGALEFYPKSIFSPTYSVEKQREIYETLKRISSIKMRKKTQGESELESSRVLKVEKRKISAIVIASSTGGPKALAEILFQLPQDFLVPIIIVQHNTSGFDKSFTQWLDTSTNLTVKLAEEGESPRPGTVYIAETDKHLEIRKKSSESFFFSYNNNEPENNQKPSADVLFRSAAECLRSQVISLVLTGMGNDGALGTKRIKEMGGITLAQDEESALIYGMPKAAVDTGSVDILLPLEKIASELQRLST
ncbi:MAG: chemotaxis-specific protein-glutamate methyltransferase CheB [Treponema sp.]|nr:chemotaxis-specific protein-glutamate methyltransferase CheB [Treponema sp.]